MVLSKFFTQLYHSIDRVKEYIGLRETQAKPTRLSRFGLCLTGLFSVVAGLWLVAFGPNIVAMLALAFGLAGFGLFNLTFAFRKNLTLSRANQLSLVGNLVLFIWLYVVASKLLYVSYSIDTVVWTYMGILKVLQLQSPYGFSIKPLLDKFGFSPSFYTPGVDGSFDFHLAYPSLSFLSIVPFYLLGLHDVRDTVFIFHIMSILTIFALAPARLKSISVLPFTLFSIVIAGSWTDSIWAFFLVLLGGVSGILFYLYSRHYRGLNSIVFAFPILIFFFYYRSFPNYMAYWLFPLVLELCRLGGPNLRLAFTTRLPSIAWRPPTGTFLRILRQRLTPSVMVVMTLTVIFAGVSGAYITQASSPRTEIQINGVMDPDSIGSATMINVTVTNLLATPVLPIFFVKYSPLTYFWASNSTSPLNSGSTSSYVISAPDALSAVPRGDQFHIVIYDKLTGQLLGESTSWKSDIPAPSLENPALKWWVLDLSVGTRVPFNWKLSLSNIDPVWSGITPLGVNGTSGVQMRLNYTSAGRGIVEGIALSQKVLLNATSVSIHLNQSLATDIASKTMFAASVTDGTHTLYFIFSDRATQQTITPYATNTTIIIPTQISTWNTIKLDPASIWTTQGWLTPTQVTLTLLLEASTVGVYSASVDEIGRV